MYQMFTSCTMHFKTLNPDIPFHMHNIQHNFLSFNPNFESPNSRKSTHAFSRFGPIAQLVVFLEEGYRNGFAVERFLALLSQVVLCRLRLYGFLLLTVINHSFSTEYKYQVNDKGQGLKYWKWNLQYAVKHFLWSSIYAYKL